MRPGRQVQAYAAALLLLAGGTASAAPVDLKGLMAALSAVRESRASFREEKALASLTQPLVSEGTLVYVAPGHLEKRTLTPVREEIVVDGDSLTFAKPDENLRRTIVLDREPEMRSLVEAVRSTLAGDLTTLKQHYYVGLAGTMEAWRLTLSPVDQRVTRFLREVRIEGSQAQLRTVETIEPDGDTSRMTIEPATP